QITNLTSDGVVITKENLDEIPHEMGHYFGLLDTFEGSGTELVNGSNCETEGDLVCDTPADPYVPGQPIENYVNVDLGCRFINPQTDANGDPYAPLVGNTMSDYPNECDCGFTNGQYLRMANTYLNGPTRMW
ncbi:MAG: M43 family zinc metalloprotease, partial [Bacteroidota bacterium]